MRQRFFTVIISLSLCLLLFSSRPIEAGGPLLVTKTGAPYVWATSQPVTFTPDQGPLGVLSNADAVALTSDLFRIWEAVPTARIRFQPAGQLPMDITGENVMEFLNTRRRASIRLSLIPTGRLSKRSSVRARGCSSLGRPARCKWNPKTAPSCRRWPSSMACSLMAKLMG